MQMDGVSGAGQNSPIGTTARVVEILGLQPLDLGAAALPGRSTLTRLESERAARVATVLARAELTP